MTTTVAPLGIASPGVVARYSMVRFCRLIWIFPAPFCLGGDAEVDGGLLAHRAVDACGAFRPQRAHAAEHGINGVHGGQAGSGSDQQRVEGRAIGGLGGQARQAEERQRGHDRPQREHLEQPRRAVRHVAGAGMQRGWASACSRGEPLWPTSPCGNSSLAGAEIVVCPAQVVPEVVGHVHPQGVAAQADQGQEELEHQDGCPHRGTNHKDGGHGYLLAEELRSP